MSEDDTFRILSRASFSEVRRELGYKPLMGQKDLEAWLETLGWTPKEFTTYLRKEHAQENISRGNV